MTMLDLAAIASIALKTSLLIAVAGIGVAVFARASAAHRHLVWTSALILAALLPLAAFLLPANAIIPLPWQAPSPDVTAVATYFAAPAASEPAAFPILWIVVAVWAGGAMALLLRDLAAHAGLLRWRKSAQATISPRWQETLDAIKAGQALPRHLTVLESAQLVSPCTWGALRPVLLLPQAGESWSDSERRDAVLHELAHIRRRDYLSAVAARIACAVHWYNPLVWFAALQVQRLQERACDDVVLRHGGRPSEYAQLLMQIARDAGGMPAGAALGMSGSALKGRVVAILNPGNARVEPGVYVIMGVLTVLSALTFFIATAAAAPQEMPRWAARSAAAVNHVAVADSNADEDNVDAVTVAANNTDNTDNTDNADDADNDANDADNDNDDSNDTDDSDSDDDATAATPPTPPVTVNVATPAIHMRNMVVHVPAIPAVNTPEIPEQHIVIAVPSVGPDGTFITVRKVIHIPAIHGVRVAGMPARTIVVKVPAVAPVPPLPPRPAHVAPTLPAPPAPPAPAEPAQ